MAFIIGSIDKGLDRKVKSPELRFKQRIQVTDGEIDRFFLAMISYCFSDEIDEARSKDDKNGFVLMFVSFMIRIFQSPRLKNGLGRIGL